MSTSIASNLITKLSFNLQPRLLLISFPRLKRSGVRCLSHKAHSSELPVRYIPKKFRGANEAQTSSSGGNSPKDTTGARSSSSNGVHGHKTLDRTKRPQRKRIDHGQPNVSFDDAHVHVVTLVIENNNNAKKAVEAKSCKTRHEEVECMNVSQEVIEELQNVKNNNCKKAVETKSSKTCQEVVEYMNVPMELTEELQNVKECVQGQGYKLNQENSNDDGLTDAEYMEVLEEDIEEIEIYNGVGDGTENGSDTARTKQGAEKLVIELLAKRAFTGVELRKKLIAKNFPVDVVDTILSDFQNRGLINDSLYAEMFSHSRWKSSSWGPRRIKQALVKKGVSECDVQKAAKVVFEDGEDSDRGSSMKLSESSLHNLYVQVSKQWQRSQNVPHEKRKARIIRWLQYRGFDWGVISNMLKKLQSNHPP